MRKPNQSSRCLIFLLAIVVPFSPGCATLINRPDFSNKPVVVSELLQSEPTPGQQLVQNTSDATHRFGRIVLVSAMVSGWILLKLSNFFASVDGDL